MSNDPFDKILVLDENPDFDDALITKLQNDLAAHLHSYEVIAHRYGMSGDVELMKYLKQHPVLMKRVKQLRAAFRAEENLENRVRMKALFSVEDLIPPLGGIANGTHGNPTTQQRIDAFKQITRVAGVDGIPAGMKGQIGSGNQFTLNIMFRDGRDNLSVSTSTNEPVALPKSVLPDDSTEYDEEV